MAKPTHVDFYVQKTGRTYGVFVAYEQDGASHDELVEGGFFSRGAAEDCKSRQRRDYRQDAAANAERAAGWDAGR